MLLCFFMVSSGDQEPTSEQLYSKGKLLYLVIASVFLIFPQNVICLQEETTPRGCSEVPMSTRCSGDSSHSCVVNLRAIATAAGQSVQRLHERTI